MANRRNRISQGNGERLIRPFDEPKQDSMVFAKTLGINHSTARGIVTRYLQEGRVNQRPRGGQIHVKINDEMRPCIK